MSEEGKFASRKDPYAVLAHYYDAEHSQLTEDVAFYADLASLAGPYILDMGCGTGRIGLTLAKEGKFVVGIDSSDTMLAVANGKLRLNRVPMELRRVDMSQMDFTNQFDLAICALDSFPHLLTIEDQQACLAGVRRALKPGGIFALDVINPNPETLAIRDGALLLQSEFESARSVPTKHFVAWRVNYESQIITVDHIYDSVSTDGAIKRRQAAFDLRYAYRFELELLLRGAGLNVQSVYSDYVRSDYTVSSDRMVIVAVREK